MSTRLPRELHPAAWWVWALGMAAAVSLTTNPLLLLVALGVVCLVVVARRGDSPWARAFRLYLYLGAFIIVLRLVLHVLVGLPVGDTVVLPLPEVGLPDWAVGIDLFGPVTLGGLLATLFEGLRLAVMIACVGAANALANPKRLLKTMPSALHEIGAALVVSVSVAPQLAESVQRVLRARRLRGDDARGLRAFGRVAMPVLEDTLDRSLLLASAMDSRGFGRRAATGPSRTLTGVLTLGGLVAAAIGCYGLLDAGSPAVMGGPALALGVVLAVTGLRIGGRAVHRTVYRPQPWGAPEWATAAAGLVAAGLMVLATRTGAGGLGFTVVPLTPPPLPLLPVVGLMVGALPAVATPPPPLAVRERGRLRPEGVVTP
jgi:energy-coupling factor transport system permease protein